MVQRCKAARTIHNLSYTTTLTLPFYVCMYFVAQLWTIAMNCALDSVHLISWSDTKLRSKTNLMPSKIFCLLTLLPHANRAQIPRDLCNLPTSNAAEQGPRCAQCRLENSCNTVKHQHQYRGISVLNKIIRNQIKLLLAYC